MEVDERAGVLADLIALRKPVGETIARVRALPWDSDDELAVLNRAGVVSVLHRYQSSEIDADELEAWADAIEGREDIRFEPGHEEMLSQFVFETANPSLTEALPDHYAASWIARMTSAP